MEQVETKVDVLASRSVGRNEAFTDTSEHPVDVLAVTMQTRWRDTKGREWRIVEKLPFGRNVCTTTNGRIQGEWTHKEIRAALARVGGGQ